MIAAMAGMFITGQHTFMGMGEATILVVAVAVLGSLTVLPATLSLLGDNLEKGRIPWFGKWLEARRDRGPSRFWSRAQGRVLARPAVSAVVSAAFLIALGVPALSLHTSVLGPSQELPHGMPIMKTYLRVQHAFPGGPQPAEVVVSGRDVTSAQVTGQIRALRREALASGEMFDPVTVDVNSAHDVAVIDVPLAGDGQNAASRAALATLRDRVVPNTVGRVADVNVAGGTASSVDSTTRPACARAIRVRVRVGLGVLAAHVELPLGRDRRDRRGSQPALGDCGLWSAGGRVPVGLGQVAARFDKHRSDHGEAAALPVP